MAIEVSKPVFYHEHLVAAAGRKLLAVAFPELYLTCLKFKQALDQLYAERDIGAGARRDRTRSQRREAERPRDRDADQSFEAKEQNPWSDMASGGMSTAQADEILGLKPGATTQEMRVAYNRLMKRVHPDVGGSEFFSKQLNAARDMLLGS